LASSTQPASWWTRAAASDGQKAAASRSRKGEREGNVGAASWVGHVTRGRRPSIHRPGRGNRGERARAVPVPPRIRGPRQLHIGFCCPFRHGRDPRSRLFRSPPGHPRNPRAAGPSPSRVCGLWLMAWVRDRVGRFGGWERPHRPRRARELVDKLDGRPRKVAFGVAYCT